jgi:hypothetical protein
MVGTGDDLLNRATHVHVARGRRRIIDADSPDVAIAQLAGVIEAPAADGAVHGQDTGVVVADGDAVDSPSIG